MSKYWILFLLLVAGSAHATCGSRVFGALSTDNIYSGYTTTVTATHSFSICYKLSGCNTFGTAANLMTVGGGIGGAGSTAFACRSTLGNAIEIQEPFSTTKGLWSVPETLGNQHCIAWSYDSGSTSNTPVVYQDGVLQTVTTVTAPVGSFNPTAGGKMYIGNQNTFDRPALGNLANPAYWPSTLLGGPELKALSQGFSPLKIRPTIQAFFEPLCGKVSPEPDWGPSHLATTVSGTTGGAGPSDFGYPTLGN